MVVLDTDVLTILQRGIRAADYDRLSRQLAAHAGDERAVTIVSFEEQTRGWLAQVAQARQPAEYATAYRRLGVLLDDYCGRRVLDFSPAAADLYADRRRTYRRHGAADLKIAAVVMIHGALLISGNVRDYSGIAGLRFEPFVP